jgi:hypothetical protein
LKYNIVYALCMVIFMVIVGCMIDEPAGEVQPEFGKQENTRNIPASCKTNCTTTCKNQGINEIINKWNANTWLGSAVDSYYVLRECGLYRRYTNGYIYTHADAGTHLVYGAIFSKWGQYGWETGFLGYPVTDELGTPDGIGRFNHFQGGSIYWTSATGAHSICGTILSKWASMGRERSLLGYPLTDETATPDGIGRFNHFQGGSIYWYPATGAHEVHGRILQRWALLGWEQGWLGYPKTDEYVWAGVCYNLFQNGYIFYHSSYGAREARYWFDGRFVYQTVNNITLPLMISWNTSARSYGTVDNFRTRINQIGLAEVSGGWSGDLARSRYDARNNWCSEFARYVYLHAGMFSDDVWDLMELFSVKTVPDFRDLFKDHNAWKVTANGQVNQNTINVGDYLALTGSSGQDKTHSAIAVAVSRCKRHVLIMEGNCNDAVNFRSIPYYQDGAVNADIDAVGKISSSWF